MRNETAALMLTFFEYFMALIFSMTPLGIIYIHQQLASYRSVSMGFCCCRHKSRAAG